jgi:hypothetical protein
MAKNRKDQVFNDKLGRHYRRTYNKREVSWGAGVLVGLMAVGGWVVWRGDNPDPELFKAAPELPRRGPAEVDRGPLPAELAPEGWSERGLATFGPDNVYEKINGREGFYKSFGFVSLAFVSVSDPEDETRGVDVEIYDLGEDANATGCLTAEAGADRPPTVRDGGLYRAEANARFMTRGRYYVRLIASDDSPRSHAALEALEASLVSALPAGELPWAFTLLAGALGVPPADIAFQTEDAFSLSVGERVHVGEIDEDGTALYLSVTGGDAAAVEARAAAFRKGFARLGEEKPDASGRPWIEDRYLSRVSTAAAAGPFVAGVYSAADLEAGAAALERLLKALEEMPADLVARALAELPEGAAAPEEASPAEEVPREDAVPEDAEPEEEYSEGEDEH